jgi:hypothetical protein
MTDAHRSLLPISVISEPDPVPEARELFPTSSAYASFLCFLFFVLAAG